MEGWVFLAFLNASESLASHFSFDWCLPLFSTWVLGLGIGRREAAGAKLPGWPVVPEPRPLSPARVQRQIQSRASNGRFGHLVISGFLKVHIWEKSYVGVCKKEYDF